jgi:hypothetical protein
LPNRDREEAVFLLRHIYDARYNRLQPPTNGVWWYNLAMSSHQPSSAGIALVVSVMGVMFVSASAVLLVVWHFAWGSRPPGLWLPSTMISVIGAGLVVLGAIIRKGLVNKGQP